MKPDARFASQPKEFWANVRTLSEALGYTVTMPGHAKPPAYLIAKDAKPKRNSEIRVPTVTEVSSALSRLGLRFDHIVKAKKPTRFGSLLLAYFRHRADVLHAIESRLMNAPAAEKLFKQQQRKLKPGSCPLPMNKQKGVMRAKAYFTCLVNMLIEANTDGFPCNYDPQALTKLTMDKVPYRTLARRVDGTFPSPTDPIAVWEIKEYYYTTTFGSRIADGVYETLLDGLEIEEAREGGCDTKHYLMVDSHYTWWSCGKPYLCRIVDMLHMGLVDEVLFGREVVDELPRIVSDWVRKAEAAGLTRIGQ